MTKKEYLLWVGYTFETMQIWKNERERLKKLEYNRGSTNDKNQ